MSLTNEQWGLLRELAADPRWTGVLEALERQPPRRYKPELGSESFYDWIYESGQSRENERILKLLTGESNV